MSNKVMLFYAYWCGHCIRFKPTWESLKNHFNKNNIEHVEFESSDKSAMEKYSISSYPTIKVQKGSDLVDYNGPRDEQSIINFVTGQTGGSQNKVMLFYADWCGHCTSFKPTWNALKNHFDKNIKL